MTLIQALILGIIQGLTEFIPVSSTAHLLIGQKILGIESSELVFAFLIIVQLGTVLSLIIYFWADLLNVVKAFFSSFQNFENFRSLSAEARFGWYIILATIPAALVGYFVRGLVETLFLSPLLSASIRLFSAATLMASAEWLGKRTRKLDEMNWLDSLIIGLFQVLAIFPGASRSGSTISGGMLRGFDRAASARFAFLMSVPIMFGVGIYESLGAFHLVGFDKFLPALIVGFISAAIIGWLAVKWLLAYLNKNSLYSFAIYCASLGVIILSIYLLG
ncbi:MAG: undecaprenyl-diphosphatase UppP [Chloroflexi bacterium]|nr:undecaprenyl-diphosphatase UppP [Chloroflexota bacterium]